jgi:quercetin dioxygenase-like cupin family protein
MKPYALAAGEGRAYEWHDVAFIMKAAGPETEGALALWELTTRPGEEPNVHTHDDVHEIFYVLSGAMTVRCGAETFRLTEGGFIFLPRDIPHGYTIDSEEVRMLGLSLPSSFGDNIEATGTPLTPR